MLHGAIGEKRIDDAVLKAEAYLNKDGICVTCDARFIPMGGGQDNVEALAWVPRAWKSKSQTPETLSLAWHAVVIDSRHCGCTQRRRALADAKLRALSVRAKR